MIASGVRKSIAFDDAGNALEIDIDPDRFAAALDEIADEDDEGRGGGDLGLTGDDDNCPICRALRAAQIGDARRAFSLDG